MALIRELPFSKYEIDMRFHTQVGWDIKKGSVGGSLNGMLWCPGQIPFPRVGAPVTPVLCWLLTFQSHPFSGQSPAASQSPHLLPPTAAEVQKASLKVQGLCSGFTKGPPPVLDQATSLLMACSFLSCTFLVYS